MKATVIQLCDAWKSSGSMSFYGVYTNAKKREGALKGLLKSGDIELEDDTDEVGSLKGLSARELNQKFKYAYIEEISLNEPV